MANRSKKRVTCNLQQEDLRSLLGLSIISEPLGGETQISQKSGRNKRVKSDISACNPARLMKSRFKREDWPSEEDQLGIILNANNYWAIEVFDKASTYRNYQPSLLRSFALEAREARERGISSRTANPRQLMDDVWSAVWLQTNTVGEGQLAVSSASRIRQCALVFKGTCISISASGALR